MAEAKLNREYAVSWLAVGALMFGVCVWSLYDGKIGWPQENAKMGKARESLLATNLTATAWLERGEDDGMTVVERVFSELGLKAPGKLSTKIKGLRLPVERANDTASLEVHSAQLRELFEKPVYSEHDIESQWIQAGVTVLLGLLLVVIVGLKAGKRFIADERGMSGSGFGPQTLAYEDITEINWEQWDEKGIIVLTFKSGRRVKLDGWHFAGVTGISEEIRKHRPDLAPKNKTG